MSKRKLKKPSPREGKIPKKALELRQSSYEEDGRPTFSFLHASDNDCLLCEWQKDELQQLVATFKKMEVLTWKEIWQHPGLDLHLVEPSKPLPPGVSPDVTVYSINVDEKKRIYGYRAGNVFRLLWFDRNHEVCPYHKVKRKRA
ncbi:MAG6450 family protein [Neomoorella thermoacetica]|uniref:MAG6450 family protein n=1 Tax=Neomoorella thermoacetica TaxID=1525 RepID=UPI0030CA62BA